MFALCIAFACATFMNFEMRQLFPTFFRGNENFFSSSVFRTKDHGFKGWFRVYDILLGNNWNDWKDIGSATMSHRDVCSRWKNRGGIDRSFFAVVVISFVLVRKTLILRFPRQWVSLGDGVLWCSLRNFFGSVNSHVRDILSTSKITWIVFFFFFFIRVTGIKM